MGDPLGFLVRKRALLGAGLIVLGAVVVAVFAVRRDLPAKSITAAGENISADQARLLEDPDGDGLKNWEEALWRTDPNKSDTDGDGTQDGAEIREGHDPSVKGTGDLAAKSPVAAASAGTLTADFAQDLLDAGLLSESFDPNHVSRLSFSNIQEGYETALNQKIAQGLQQLKTGGGSGGDADRRYFQETSSIFLKNYQAIKKNDLAVIETILKDPNRLGNAALLDPYIQAAKNTIRDIRAVQAPENVSSYHERTVRVLIKTEFELTALRNISGDPTLALLALQNRIATKIEFSRLYNEEIVKFLKEQQITFGGGSPANQVFNWE